MPILFASKLSQMLGIKAMIFRRAILTTDHVIILLHKSYVEYTVNYEISQLGYAAHEL